MGQTGTNNDPFADALETLVAQAEEFLGVFHQLVAAHRRSERKQNAGHRYAIALATKLERDLRALLLLVRQRHFGPTFILIRSCVEATVLLALIGTTDPKRRGEFGRALLNGGIAIKSLRLENQICRFKEDCSKDLSPEAFKDLEALLLNEKMKSELEDTKREFNPKEFGFTESFQDILQTVAQRIRNSQEFEPGSLLLWFIEYWKCTDAVHSGPYSFEMYRLYEPDLPDAHLSVVLLSEAVDIAKIVVGASNGLWMSLDCPDCPELNSRGDELQAGVRAAMETLIAKGRDFYIEATTPRESNPE